MLEEADGWAKQGKPNRALDVIRSTLRIVPDTPAAPLLRKMEPDRAFAGAVDFSHATKLTASLNKFRIYATSLIALGYMPLPTAPQH